MSVLSSGRYYLSVICWCEKKFTLRENNKIENLLWFPHENFMILIECYSVFMQAEKQRNKQRVKWIVCWWYGWLSRVSEERVKGNLIKRKESLFFPEQRILIFRVFFFGSKTQKPHTLKDDSIKMEKNEKLFLTVTRHSPTNFIFSPRPRKFSFSLLTPFARSHLSTVS